MASLFREPLPVVVLEHGTARTAAALQSTRPTTLTASLSQHTAGADLVFTLSDLETQLLFLQQTITAANYAALRDAQALRVDFSGFPRELASLLRRPSTDTTFVAVLCLRDGGQHSFEIVQLSEFRLLSHVELSPSNATQKQLMHALANRARDESAAAQAARAHADAARAESTRIAAQLAEERQQHAHTRSQRDRLEALRALADRAVAQLAGEVRRANGTIERLRHEVRGARERERVRAAVMEKQESAVADGEARAATLARDLQRARDAAALKTTECDGLRRRLGAAEKRADDNEFVLANNRELISFLNRELNRRDALLATPTPPPFGSKARTPSSADTTRVAPRTREGNTAAGSSRADAAAAAS